MTCSIWIAALFATLSLTACDKPVVVNAPPIVVAVPGPAGPQGEAGKPGNTTVVVVPQAASAPTN